MQTLVKEDEPYIRSPLQQTPPSQLLYQWCYMWKSAILIESIPCSASLNRFQFILILLSVWIPNCCCVFELWADQCSVGIYFDMGLWYFQVSSKECKRSICLIADIVYMVIPTPLAVAVVVGVSDAAAAGGCCAFPSDAFLPLLDDWLTFLAVFAGPASF